MWIAREARGMRLRRRRNSSVVIVGRRTHIKSFSFKRTRGDDCVLSVNYKRSASNTIRCWKFHKNSFILHKYKLSLIMSFCSRRRSLPLPIGLTFSYQWSRVSVCLCVIFTVHLLLFEQGPGNEKEEIILNSFVS